MATKPSSKRASLCDYDDVVFVHERRVGHPAPSIGFASSDSQVGFEKVLTLLELYHTAGCRLYVGVEVDVSTTQPSGHVVEGAREDAHLVRRQHQSNGGEIAAGDGGSCFGDLQHRPDSDLW